MKLLNLFSMFDPSSSIFSLSWFLMIFLLGFPIMSFFSKTKMNKFLTLLSGKLILEMKSNLSDKKKFNFSLLLSLFISIIFFNTMALSPYTFTVTAHLSTNFSLALVLWLSFILFQMGFKSKEMLIHLVPMGTPSALLPIMVLIELTSIIIRPITLSVRLTANMIAGHLLLSLLGEASTHSMFFSVANYFVFLLLLTLESAVAIIQAYVFMTLISLYINEIF